MTLFLTSNNASTTLAGPVTAGATTCSLAPGTGANFPNPAAGQQFALTFVDAATGLNNEIVYVTARSGDTITSMARAQEGTTAKAWLAGDLANNFYTSGQDAAKAQIPGVQNNTYTYAADTGAANAYAVSLSPAPTLAQGAIIGFTAAHANTTASTLVVNGGTAYPIWGAAHSALQGGEIALNGYVEVEYNPTLNGGNPVYLLLECTGGALQIAPATQSQHAIPAGQAAGVVGSARNLAMSVTAAAATATLTADEIVVETALGGVRYCLPNFNKTINLATTGAGGMDTGSAPVSGYVALYAIYNPSTGVSALLATNATSITAPNVYGGGSMPPGYTASALVSVWPTNGSSQFKIAYQKDRQIGFQTSTVISTTTNSTSLTSLSIASVVPKNAVKCDGFTLSTSSTGTGGISISVASDANNSNQFSTGGYLGATGVGVYGSFVGLLMPTQQTLYYATGLSGGITAATWAINISSYTF